MRQTLRKGARDIYLPYYLQASVSLSVLARVTGRCVSNTVTASAAAAAAAVAAVKFYCYGIIASVTRVVWPSVSNCRLCIRRLTATALRVKLSNRLMYV